MKSKSFDQKHPGDNFPKIIASRDPQTRHVLIMPLEDRENHKAFIDEYMKALKTDGIVELQLARQLAQDTWRINRLHAVEENICALAHSDRDGDLETAHANITAAYVQAMTFRRTPQLFALLALYEQRIARNFHANFRLLLKLQALRGPVAEKRSQPEPQPGHEQNPDSHRDSRGPRCLTSFCKPKNGSWSGVWGQIAYARGLSRISRLPSRDREGVGMALRAAEFR